MVRLFITLVVIAQNASRSYFLFAASIRDSFYDGWDVHSLYLMAGNNHIETRAWVCPRYFFKITFDNDRIKLSVNSNHRFL